MLNTKFIAMKKITFLLFLICVFVHSIFANSNNADEKFNLTPKIKKGDWFIVEFSDQLENYNLVKNESAYKIPVSFKRLSFKFEIEERTSKEIEVNIVFDRLWDLSEEGYLFDSYFVEPEHQTLDQINIHATINIKNLLFEINLPSILDSIYFYTTKRESASINKKTITTYNSKETINRVQILKIINQYLDYWSQFSFQCPIPSFGKIEDHRFRYYRILDSNIKLQPNTKVTFDIEGAKNGDTVKISTKGTFYNSSKFRINSIVSGNIVNNELILNYYLKEQKRIVFSFREKQFWFVATPGKKNEIRFLADNVSSTISIKSENSGDNQFYLENTSTDRYYPHQGWKWKNVSMDSAINKTELKLKERIFLLNQYRDNMSVNWYKRELKSLYYWAAVEINNWHYRNGKINLPKILELTPFQNIVPSTEYYLEINEYEQYLTSLYLYEFFEIYESLPLSHGFINISNSENYFLYKDKYKGFPKYYYLKKIVSQNIKGAGIEYSKEQYHDFMDNCKYPKFKEELKLIYEEYNKLEPGKSIFGLDLNFVNKKQFDKKNSKYKIVEFLIGDPKYFQLDYLKNSINKTAEELNLQDNIELYLVGASNELKNLAKIRFNQNEKFQTHYVTIKDPLKLYDDFRLLDSDGNKLLILSPDNKIISRVSNKLEIKRNIEKYIQSQNQPKSHEGRRTMILGALTSLLLIVLATWLAVRITAKLVAKKEAARRKLSELELKAIRSQMNPHFIFNAMGSIQNLINQNKTKNANLYLSSFARLMRMVLTNSNKKLVSLSDELELLKHYLELEQLRVDFQFTISLSENIDPETEEIPGMLVQPFVENAVIHGITPKGKGNISVEFSKKDEILVCEIIDDGVGINTKEVGNGNGVAMKLSEKRLNLLNSQLLEKLRLTVENRMDKEKIGGTKITLLIPVG